MTIKTVISPTQLTNVGTMSKRELEDLLKTFPAGARIERTELLIRVRPPKIDTIVFQAAILSKNIWHVRAAPGLIQKVVK